MSIQTYEILSHALFLYIYGIRRNITQTYNFQEFVGGVHKLYEPGGSLCPPVLGNCNV